MKVMSWLIDFLSCERLWTTIIGTISGGMITYYVNSKLQSLREERECRNEEEKNKGKDFEKICIVLYALERNARHLFVCYHLLTDHYQKNGTNDPILNLDPSDFHKDILSLLDHMDINHLYIIEYSIKNLIKERDQIWEIKTELIKSSIIDSHQANKHKEIVNSYLEREKILLENIYKQLFPLIIHIKFFCTQIVDKLKSQYPTKELPKINFDFIKETEETKENETQTNRDSMSRGI